MEYFICKLDSLEPNISLQEGPNLSPKQSISNPHQHENSAIITIILLRIIQRNLKSRLATIEQSAELERILENRHFLIVFLLLPERVIYSDALGVESGKEPVITVVDRHDQAVLRLDVLLLEESLDHLLVFLKVGCCEEAIQETNRSVPPAIPVEQLQIGIDDIIIKPLAMIYPAHRLVGDGLNSIKTGLLDLSRSSPLLPKAPDFPEILEGYFRIVQPLFRVLALQESSNLDLILLSQIILILLLSDNHLQLLGIL